MPNPRIGGTDVERGYSDEFITEVLSHLPDPINLPRDERVLQRYGLSCERLMDRMGGSPELRSRSVPGVFAAGDVRSGSSNRVAAAVGEGASANQGHARS
jgi:NADPH-dependent glutamate synthase beta subunit-like oxidoreductase